jgi:endonuclease/exonuclease/phosphatase family metal-dependent hydrolase
MRIATWNLHGASGRTATRLGDAFHAVGGADLVLLQEVSVTGLPRFQDAAGLDWAFHVGQEFPEMLRVVSRNIGPRCVAIGGRGPRPSRLAPFPDMLLPEKILAAWTSVDGQLLTLVSYHAPTGAQHGIGKAEQAVRLARWLARIHDSPVIVGGDFNTPLVDPLDDAGVVTHWHTGGPKIGTQIGDDALVGPKPSHGLRDGYRTWLQRHPAEREAIRQTRPQGPLATTHVLRGGSPMRYDQIWFTEHFTVHAVQHLYTEARTAGSDHALVIADVALDLQERAP